jgi:single-strand DNA-binding protein
MTLNKFFIVGNVASDPESRTTASGVAQCSFRVATQRRFANQSGVREADFHQVVCWRNTAEFASKYLLKGRKVAVEGSVQYRSYDAQDGTKRWVTEVIADNLEILDRNETKPAAAETVAKAQETFGAGFVEVEDDALPF